MRFGRAAQSVIHYRAVVANEQLYQSDRSYPPYLSVMDIDEVWFDPESCLERIAKQTAGQAH